MRLAWETATESDNAGFHVFRSPAGADEYRRITTALIPAEGDEFTGASYELLDEDVTAGETYLYRLEDIDIYGQSTFHGPVEATVQREPFFGCVMAASGAGAVGLWMLLAVLALAGMRRRR